MLLRTFKEGILVPKLLELDEDSLRRASRAH